MDLGSNLVPNVYGGNCCAIQGILEQMDFLKIVFQLEQPFQGACIVEHWQRVERFFSEVDDLILDQEWVGPKIDFDISKCREQIPSDKERRAHLWANADSKKWQISVVDMAKNLAHSFYEI